MIRIVQLTVDRMVKHVTTIQVAVGMDVKMVGWDITAPKVRKHVNDYAICMRMAGGSFTTIFHH